MSHKIEKVAVVGLGTLGAQIACLTAGAGYQVTAYDPDRDIFQKSMTKLMAVDQSRFPHSRVKVARWPEEAKRIVMADSLAEAVARADLVMEVVPENLDSRRRVWGEMDQAAPPQAIFATNSSSIPVSKIETAVKRPEKCLNIHFYQPVMGQYMADIMGGTMTAPEVMETGKRWIASLGFIPLTVKKELLGFCFNRVWRAVKKEVLHMWADDYVDHRDVDRGWMIFNGTTWGPFALMDAVGLDVVWDIEMVYYNDSQDPKDHPPQALKDMISEGKLGVKSGQGFYTYPDPEYQRPEFLIP